MDVKGFIKTNKERNKALESPYNPATGLGCYGDRFLLSLPDSPIGDMWLPIQMKDIPSVIALDEAGSFKAILKEASKRYEDVDYSLESIDDAWLAFCELRMEYDFEYFAYSCETIMDKESSELIPFVLNKGQRKLLSVLMVMFLEKVPIRVILVKARQWGGSTLTQMFMFWIQIIHKRNWNSVICAHLMDAAKNVRAMYEMCADEMIPIDGVSHTVSPYKQTQNIKFVPERGCKITVGSAVEPESVRSQDVKMAHFSEVAYYPKTENTNARKLVTSIASSIPLIPYTMIVYESTANGVGDFFHSECVRAEAGLSPFEFVFVSWFEIGNLYSAPFNGYYYEHSGRRFEGGIEDFVKGMNEYELNLFRNNEGVTLEHLNWYRYKKAELQEDMPKEFPSDWIEAFKHSGEITFRAEDIEALRAGCNYPVEAVGVMDANGNAASAKLAGQSLRSLTEGVRFIPEPDLLNIANSPTADPKVREQKLNNRLVVWKFPDKDIEVANRYFVIYDPAKGVSNGADWGVITVLDRYWRIFGGKTEVVAEWRGHIDKDIAVWIAVQIAIFYNNALLIIESNTFDSDYKKEDESEFIFETISDYYGNLYGRTESDKVKASIPVRYGFHTNKRTKPAIISNYVAVLRERAYIERSHNTLNQARVYERKKDGSYGAKEGHHDDDLITRMIGLFVDYLEWDMPHLIDRSASKSLTRTYTNESSF
ncbi:MAG: hypothetical protein LBV72_00520 [Tannerella sp.]|jgi:hypothetical protein|nr:hypothetical protein [Tannerella sp.]